VVRQPFAISRFSVLTETSSQSAASVNDFPTEPSFDNFFEQFASNETIEEMLKTAGFTDVRVTGDGTTRVAKGRWMRPDITGPVDPHLSDILELP